MVGGKVEHLFEHGRPGNVGDAADDDPPWFAARVGVDRH